MDRDSLQLLLRRGLSLAEIARRFGKHESTIAYWVRKHGLAPVYSREHAAKGALERELLERLIAEEMTIAEIAARVERSKATVRHWLLRYGLRTQNGRGKRAATPRRGEHPHGRLRRVPQ